MSDEQHVDRFATPVEFSTGVSWKPTKYASIDQTPYLEYLDRNEDKLRKIQEELR